LGRRRAAGSAEEERRRGERGAEAVRPLLWGRRRGGGRAEEGWKSGGGRSIRIFGAEGERRKGSASLKIQGVASSKIQGGASSLAYVIIICNDVTRASLDESGQNLLTKHFLASLHVCDTIDGLRLAYYE
jgi:hypothetical protein